jgi:serralysin
MKSYLAIVFCFILLSCGSESVDKTKSITASENKSVDLPSHLRWCTELPPPSLNGRPAGASKQSLWPLDKKVLAVKFLNGQPEIQNKVISFAKEWENYCGMQFDFTSSEKPDITITLETEGSWSAIGRNSRKLQPSMGFGWLTSSTPDNEFRQVVLHEFGHALGLIHEHQNPNSNPIQWNKQAVYAYQLKQYGWSKEQVDVNVFNRYNENSIQSSVFDPLSIMLYAVPAELTLNGYQTEWNSELSSADKAFIQSVYPK